MQAVKRPADSDKPKVGVINMGTGCVPLPRLGA